MKMEKFDQTAKYNFAKIELRDHGHRGAVLAKIRFTESISKKLDLGTVYKSCDLYWMKDQQMIVLKVFTDPDEGQRKLTTSDRGVCVAATMFFEQFDIPWVTQTQYRVAQLEDGMISVQIKDGRATWKLRRENHQQ